MGCHNSKGYQVNNLQVANGIANQGSRVTYCYTRSQGGNNNWYQGYVQKCWSRGYLDILFDDGDYWNVNSEEVFLYQPPLHNKPVNIIPGEPCVVVANQSVAMPPLPAPVALQNLAPVPAQVVTPIPSQIPMGVVVNDPNIVSTKPSAPPFSQLNTNGSYDLDVDDHVNQFATTPPPIYSENTYSL